jgi:hypothetical protein
MEILVKRKFVRADDVNHYRDQGPGVLSIRHDSPDSIHAAGPVAHIASAPVRGRRVVENDPDI